MVKPHGGKLINRILSGKERDHAIERFDRLPQIEVSPELARDIANIAHGVFSPLEGFLGAEDFKHVVDEMRLTSDLPWTLPIILDISREKAASLKDEASLICDSQPVALLQVEDRYRFDPEDVARKVYGTADSKHPGVGKTLRMGEVLIGGKISLLDEPKTPFEQFYLKPAETRVLFKEKGWRTVVGFQTRNIPHLGHEFVQKTALSFADGLFINPVIGRKKKGDFTDHLILDTYQTLIEHYYLKDHAVMSILQTEMRYAGPREAIFHAIVRKNFGCTHFIVGRDHAGVGDYYGPFAAQDIFEEFPDLGIAPLFFKSFFYCKRCGGVANEKTCPHGGDDHIGFSGTRIRQLLVEGKIPPKELMRPEVAEMIIKEKDPFVE